MTEGEPTAVTDAGPQETVVTDRELFDQAISNEPASPEPAKAEPVSANAETVQPGETPAEIQARDEKGRFAQGKVPAPTEDKPQLPPALNAPEPQAQPAPQAAPPQQQQPQHVPLKVLLEERERRQNLEKQAAQMTEALQYMQRMVQQQQPQPQQPQAPQQTIFDGPEEYLRTNVMEPLRNEGYRTMLEIRDGMSRDYANDKYGEKVVEAAFEAMKKVRNTVEGDAAYRQIMQHGNPYKALVQWHQRHRAHEAIGQDPDGWLRQRQQEWVKDPNAHKAVLEYLRQNQQQQKPSAAQSPNVQLPPSLSTIPAASGRADGLGDLTDASLYNFATR